MDLKQAIQVVEISAAIAVLLLLGDYLGYKFGRWRLAAIAGVVNLLFVIAFAVYAGFILA